MAEPRTFKVTSPLMHGDDIRRWQIDIRNEFNELDIDCPIEADGIYGAITRSYNASLCHALGMYALDVMKDGITPELRTKIRHRELTVYEKERFNQIAYIKYRGDLRDKWHPNAGRVHKPVSVILQHSWGYHPGVHDGVDVICNPDVPIFAMVRCRVIDVRPSGWWGLGAPSNPDIKAKGDGIIQVEILDNIGPFIKGNHIGYGHAEKAVVKIGQEVKAGQVLGHAGLANAWHIHLMCNDGSTDRGIGNRNPEPLLNYTIEHG